MRIFLRILFFSILGTGLVACNNKNDDTINRITESLKEDLNLGDIDITNAVELMAEGDFQAELSNNIVLATEDYMADKTTNSDSPVFVTEVIDVAEVPYVPNTQRADIIRMDTPPKTMPARIQKRERLKVVQQESYIKVGIDKPGIIVGQNKSQKITVVVFPETRSTMVDVYLYAIPTTSELVRNDNTLIGFVKGIEFINKQAQFTRYWTAKLADGRPLKSRKYNIYVEYHYRNAQGQVTYIRGRFWGGNHRRWNVRV